MMKDNNNNTSSITTNNTKHILLDTSCISSNKKTKVNASIETATAAAVPMNTDDDDGKNTTTKAGMKTTGLLALDEQNVDKDADDVDYLSFDEYEFADDSIVEFSEGMQWKSIPFHLVLIFLSFPLFILKNIFYLFYVSYTCLIGSNTNLI